MQEKSKQAIEDREKELQKLRKAVETYKVSLYLEEQFQDHTVFYHLVTVSLTVEKWNEEDPTYFCVS